MKLQTIIASLAILFWTGTAKATPDLSHEAKTTMDVSEESSKPNHDKMKEWEKLHEQFIIDTKKFRNELKARQMEYRALKNNTQVTPAYVRELTEDIVELEDTLNKMRADFNKKSKDEFGLDFSKKYHNFANDQKYHQQNPHKMKKDKYNHGNCQGKQHESMHKCMNDRPQHKHDIEEKTSGDEIPKAM